MVPVFFRVALRGQLDLWSSKGARIVPMKVILNIKDMQSSTISDE